MELATTRAHRLLQYIAAAARQGHEISSHDAEAYLRAMDDRGNLFFASGIDAFFSLPSPLRWLIDVRWLEEGPSLVVTNLGKAMLRELDAQERRTALEPSGALILKAGDQFALSELIQEIAAVGPAAIVDPYFDVDGLRAVAAYTDVRRVLTGPRNSARLAGLSHAMGEAAKIGVEIRVGEGLHDRALVPDSGGYWILSNSLNGIGKNMAILAQLPEGLAAMAREAFEAQWVAASPLAEETLPDVVEESP